MANKVKFDAVLKRVCVIVLASMILMNFPGLFEFLPPTHAETQKNLMDVSGYFFLDYVTPIRYAHVHVYAKQTLIDSKLDETYTNEDGYFCIKNMFNIGYDVFAIVYSENWAAKVLNEPYFLAGGRYSFNSKTIEHAPDGQVYLGKTICPPSEKPGFSILMAITQGWTFIRDKCGQKMLPQVDAFFDDIGCVGNSYYYNGFIHKLGLTEFAGTVVAAIFGPVVAAVTYVSLEGISRGLEGIHISSGDERNLGVILHEYGHFVMDKFGDFWPPFSKMVHYGDRPHDQETAWLEGWAHLFSSAVRQSLYLPLEGYIGLGGDSLNLNITNTLQGDTVEGAVAGALWEMYETKGQPISFGDILDVESIVPHPHNIHEFWNNFKQKFSSGPSGPTLDVTRMNVLWQSLNRHGIVEPDYDGPHNPTMYHTSERVGVMPENPSSTVKIDWYGAWDGISGIKGYAFIWDTSPSSAPTLLLDPNLENFTTDQPSTWNSWISPVMSMGHDWYFHVRAIDYAGNWASWTLHVGPFLRGGGASEFSNLVVKPFDVIYDNEEKDMTFKADWFDPSGMSAVSFRLFRDDEFIDQYWAYKADTDANGNGMWEFDMPKDMWIYYFGHRLMWESWGESNNSPSPTMTPRQEGPFIADDDPGPVFKNFVSTGDVWDNDTTWDYYHITVTLETPRPPLTSLYCRIKVGDGDWSTWFSIAGWPPTIPEVKSVDIPRYYIIQPTTRPGSEILFQFNATDSDNDRYFSGNNIDAEESISPVYLAGRILDDDVEPPTLSAPSVEYLESQGVLRIRIYAEDPSGISSVEFSVRMEEKDGWPNDYTSPWSEHTGDAIERHMVFEGVKGHLTMLQLHSFWYDIPLSVADPTGSGNIDKRFYWRVYACDDDGDLLGDGASVFKEFVYTPAAPWGCAIADVKLHSEALHLVGNGISLAAYIEIQSSNLTSLDASSMEIGSILVNGTIPVDLHISATFEDYDNDGKPELMVCFDRMNLSNFILSKGIKYGNVTLTIAGLLWDGTPIEGNVVVAVGMPGDTNGDCKVDGKDITIAAMAFASCPGYPRWNGIPDQNEDNKIDGKDIVLIALNFGKAYT